MFWCEGGFVSFDVGSCFLCAALIEEFADGSLFFTKFNESFCSLYESGNVLKCSWIVGSYFSIDSSFLEWCWEFFSNEWWVDEAAGCSFTCRLFSGGDGGCFAEWYGSGCLSCFDIGESYATESCECYFVSCCCGVDAAFCFEYFVALEVFNDSGVLFADSYFDALVLVFFDVAWDYLFSDVCACTFWEVDVNVSYFEVLVSFR